MMTRTPTPRSSLPTPARHLAVLGLLGLLSLVMACNGPKARRPALRNGTPPPPPPATVIPTATNRPVRLAIIGDYGDPNPAADKVAAMVHAWHPDLVLTVGDNNYPVGDAATIDANIGKRYGSFIKPYKGRFGPGSPDHNRFFPALGNHDWYANNAKAYFDWFELPGNERYYDIKAGAAHLLFVDSDRHDPDGNDKNSRQASWLRSALAASTAPFRFVFFHHPPFNTGRHKPAIWMRWPFGPWGATATFAGHNHHYERLRSRGLTHVVTGHSGRALYPFAEPIAEGSQVRVYGVFGAMRASISATYARFESITTTGIVIDSFGMPPSHGPNAPKGQPTALRRFGQAWWVLDGGKTPPADWATAAPTPSAALPWRQAKAPFGRGKLPARSALKMDLKTADSAKTAFFRATVTIPGGPKTKPPAWIRLRLVRDDGARVLINGVEVWRLNLPLGPISATTPAGYDLRWGNETDVIETWLPGKLLHGGDNTIAVSLHQAQGAERDARFDLALDGWGAGAKR